MNYELLDAKDRKKFRKEDTVMADYLFK